uniref:transposase n=1 Tax=Galbibacter sp. PAP.153 TaxID=3104623 RepID=UPI0030091B8B
QEQKRKYKNNPFLVQNLYYNAKEDYCVCPMGQHLENIATEKRKSSTGYASTVTHYQAVRCEGCPLRGMCHKAEGNRIIKVNNRLVQLRAQAKKPLISQQGPGTP